MSPGRRNELMRYKRAQEIVQYTYHILWIIIIITTRALRECNTPGIARAILKLFYDLFRFMMFWLQYDDNGWLWLHCDAWGKSHWSNKKCVAQLSLCPFIWHITQYGFFKFVLQGQLWPKMLMKVNPSTHVSERLHILLWGLTHKNVITYFLLCSDLYRIFNKMISAWAVTGIYPYTKFEKMISCKLWMLRCKHTITYSLPSRGE